MMPARSAPELLAMRATREPDGLAYRAKKLGLYRERCWRDYASDVATAAHGLRALGLAGGERIAIMGDACEEWLLADLGAQALGAIVYGIYPTASTAELEYQMLDGGACIFIAEDQEQVDRLLPVADRLPSLRWIVAIDSSAMFGYRHPKLRSFEEVMGLGGTRGVADLAALADRIAADAPAFIVYTSGTSGQPKGALVSHAKHLAATQNLVDHYPALAEREHRTVVYLPLCHILGRDIGVTLPLLSRLVPHFGEDVEDLPRTFFEVAPTVLFTVPRFLQKFASQVLVGIGSTSPIKKAAYDLAMRVAREQARARWEGRMGESFPYTFARSLVFRPLLGKLGLDALELVISGGAPLPAQTMALWQMWGVN
ncbi:MAG: AMP-binding protein, partial [Burkholderiales bacterium]